MNLYNLKFISGIFMLLFFYRSITQKLQVQLMTLRCLLPTWVCPCMAARCRGVYPALDLAFTLTGMVFSLAKASSWASSSGLPCLAAQWRQVKPVTKSLLATRLGSTASRACRLSHSPSEEQSIHSCSRGSRVTEELSSSVAEERTDEESPSLLTESRLRDPRLIRDLRTCVQRNST